MTLANKALKRNLSRTSNREERAMTPERLRELVEEVGRGEPIGLTRPIEIIQGYAAALEEIERLNAAWKAQQFHLEAEERESAHWQERAEKAERMAERLERHAEAMAKYLTIDGQSCRPEDECSVCAILSAYRAEFKGE